MLRHSPDDPYAITANPRFVSPESAAAGFETLRGFMLQKVSPAIGTGMAISPNVDRDLFGNALPKGLPPSIGIHEFKKAVRGTTP